MVKQQNLNILQVIPYFGMAGAERMCENLSVELNNLAKVFVISFYDYHSPITDRIEASGIKIYYLSKHKGFDFSLIKRIREVLLEIKPDVIHTHLSCLMYIVPSMIGLNIPVCVHTIHNQAQKESPRLVRFFNKFFYKKSNVVPVALTSIIRQTIVDEYNLDEKNVPIIFNGAKCNCLEQKNDYSFSNTIKIINVARLNEQKNHFELIDAIVNLHKKYPNIILRLVGDGPLKNQISDYIKSNGAEDFVILEGLSDNPEKLLLDSDIFVLPSKYEGMPMTIIEAMMIGLPIVASKVGGVPDIVDDNKNALLCQPNQQDISNKLEMLISDSNLRCFIANNAKEKSILFSSRIMAENYLNLYNSILLKNTSK